MYPYRLKRHEKIFGIGPLYRQYGAPRINRLSDFANGYARYTPSDVAELREGLQSEDDR